MKTIPDGFKRASLEPKKTIKSIASIDMVTGDLCIIEKGNAIKTAMINATHFAVSCAIANQMITLIEL